MHKRYKESMDIPKPSSEPFKTAINNNYSVRCVEQTGMDNDSRASCAVLWRFVDGNSVNSVNGGKDTFYVVIVVRAKRATLAVIHVQIDHTPALARC